MSDPHVLTFVASDSPLGEGVLGGVLMTLLEHGVADSDIEKTWLSPKKALDITIPFKPSAELFSEISETLAHARVDCFVHPVEGRRKKLFVADMDSTIVDGEVLDDMAATFGLGDMVSAITQQSMRGELNFESSLRKRVALLAGKPSSVLRNVRESIVLNAGAEVLVETMRRHGVLCVLLSGGFVYFTSHVADKCRFNHHHGNRLIIKNDVITGFLDDPILDRDAKLSFMQEYMAQKHLKASQVLALGDGANDKAMIDAAGLGIGYYPKPIIAQTTQNIIQFGDLTAALYAQGYNEKEFRRPLRR